MNSIQNNILSQIHVNLQNGMNLEDACIEASMNVYQAKRMMKKIENCKRKADAKRTMDNYKDSLIGGIGTGIGITVGTRVTPVVAGYAAKKAKQYLEDNDYDIYLDEFRERFDD